MAELVDAIALEAIAQYGRVGASPTKCTLNLLGVRLA